MNDSFNLSPISKQHKKRAISFNKSKLKNGAHVFEIESPVNKHDLVRLEDNYGREGKPYESIEFQKPRNLIHYGWKSLKLIVQMNITF